MKNNPLVYLFIFYIIFFSFACGEKKTERRLDTVVDSHARRLEEAAYRNPDSVLLEATRMMEAPGLQKGLEKGRGLLLLAHIHQLKGNYDTSISIANQAIPLVQSHALLTAKLHNELGVNYDYKAEYRSALTHYQLAQQYFSETNDTIGLLNTKNNIGLVHQNSGDLQRAKEYFTDVLEMSSKHRYDDVEIMALSNLGAVHNELHHYDTALRYFREVMQYDLESGNETYISFSYHNVGEALKNLRRFDSAAYYLSNAVHMKERLGLKANLVNSYKAFADMLIETGRLNEAHVYLNKAFLLAKETGAKDYLQDCYYLQSRLAEKNGDYKTAYTASEAFHTIQDSIASAKVRGELVAKEKDYELTLKNRELQFREKEINDAKREKTALVLFTMLFALVAAALFYLLRKQRNLNKKLEQQKKQIEEGLALRNQFLSFLAHEIRNPLGAMIGLGNLLLKEPLTAGQKELIDYQQKASGHLLTLLNDVLDYQKLNSQKVALNRIGFSLEDVLHQAYGLYHGAITQKHLSCHIAYDERIPSKLLGDPVRLIQVFSNLLNNAIKFADAGTITIAAQLVGRIEHEATVHCSVVDTGASIAKEDQELIFELYVQSSKNKTAQLGTGLGLSIVKNLLALMDSNIELESTPGEGTTFSFTITFPIAQ